MVIREAAEARAKQSPLSHLSLSSVYLIISWLAARSSFFLLLVRTVESIPSGISSWKQRPLSDSLRLGEGAQAGQACSSCHPFAARPRACCCKVTSSAVLLRIVNIRVLTACILQPSTFTKGPPAGIYLTRSIGLESASKAPCLTFPSDRVLQVDLYEVHLHPRSPIHQARRHGSFIFSPPASTPFRSIAILYAFILFTCEEEVFPSTASKLLEFSLLLPDFNCRSTAAKPSWQGR